MLSIIYVYMEPIKGITECDKSQEQAELTSDAAIIWILEQVKTDRTDQAEYDTAIKADDPSSYSPPTIDRSNYLSDLQRLFDLAISEGYDAQTIKAVTNYGYAFEVMLCIFLGHILNTSNGKLSVVIVPEAIDHTNLQAHREDDDKQQVSFDILIYQTATDSNAIPVRIPIIGISAKAKEYLGIARINNYFNIPIITINGMSLWGNKVDDKIFAFLQNPHEYISWLLQLTQEQLEEERKKFLAKITKSVDKALVRIAENIKDPEEYQRQLAILGGRENQLRKILLAQQ